MRERKPWVRLRLSTLGWNVLFMTLVRSQLNALAWEAGSLLWERAEKRLAILEKGGHGFNC